MFPGRIKYLQIKHILKDLKIPAGSQASFSHLWQIIPTGPVVPRAEKYRASPTTA